jgi:hypothetical protein
MIVKQKEIMIFEANNSGQQEPAEQAEQRALVRYSRGLPNNWQRILEEWRVK